jgi:beta-mannanase
MPLDKHRHVKRRHVVACGVFTAWILSALAPGAHAAMTPAVSPHVATLRRVVTRTYRGAWHRHPATVILASVAGAISSAPATSTTPTAAAGAVAPIALGAYIYGAPWNTAPLDDFTRMAGAPPAIVMWYQDWARPSDNSFDPVTMDAIVKRGSTPMITWEPWDPTLGTTTQPSFALDTIISGSHDSYIRAYADAAAAWGKPFYLRFAHEMNGNWYSWSPGANGNTSAGFVAAWRHVVDIFRQEGANNARWIWSPNVEYGGTTPFAAIYPGDIYVDGVALDGYNWGTTQAGKTWQSLTDIFGPSYDDLIGLSAKPVMIAETASAEAGGDKAAWITQSFLSDVPRRFPRVRAIVWFDENKETNWLVNSSPAALAAYRQVVASPLYHQDSPPSISADVAPTSTPTNTPTPTSVPLLPTATTTNSPTPQPPTSTATPVPPTATAPAIPATTPVPQTLFSTGFEQGDSQPAWYDAVDWSSGMTGVCCGLTQPESSPRREIARVGSVALMYSGAATGASQNYSYDKVFDLWGRHITIGPATKLSYWIYPQTAGLTRVDNSVYVTIDIVFTDGSALRDSGAVDQYGVRLHPHYQGQGGRLALNAWDFVASNIGADNAGKTIDRILVAYDRPASTGGYRGYIDDIKIAG